MPQRINQEMKGKFDVIFKSYTLFCANNLTTGIFCCYMVSASNCRFAVAFSNEEFGLVEFMNFL